MSAPWGRAATPAERDLIEDGRAPLRELVYEPLAADLASAPPDAEARPERPPAKVITPARLPADRCRNVLCGHERQHHTHQIGRCARMSCSCRHFLESGA